jgi:hypothetical protein
MIICFFSKRVFFEYQEKIFLFSQILSIKYIIFSNFVVCLKNRKIHEYKEGMTHRSHPLSTILYFSFLTPLKGSSSAFWSMNLPPGPRFVQRSFCGLYTCERSLTAPWRWSSPLGGLVAIAFFLLPEGPSFLDKYETSILSTISSDILAGAPSPCLRLGSK